MHDLILALPEGYDTVVGEGGGRLSGGQRQRLAIARALLRQPAILLLDEATSALDAGTEASITATLETLRQRHTIIQVTHRLATITTTDCIFCPGARRPGRARDSYRPPGPAGGVCVALAQAKWSCGQ